MSIKTINLLASFSLFLPNIGILSIKNHLKELEIFFKEEGVIASNRDLYLPSFENN